MFFKHQYITQPPVTPADILTKAIDDLAAALKQQRIRKSDKLLNQNSPATTKMPNPKVERITTALPNPRVERSTTVVPNPRVKGMTIAVPAPRVSTSILVPPPREAIATQKPMPEIKSHTKPKELPPK